MLVVMFSCLSEWGHFMKRNEIRDSPRRRRFELVRPPPAEHQRFLTLGARQKEGGGGGLQLPNITGGETRPRYTVPRGEGRLQGDQW